MFPISKVVLPKVIMRKLRACSHSCSPSSVRLYMHNSSVCTSFQFFPATPNMKSYRWSSDLVAKSITHTPHTTQHLKLVPSPPDSNSSNRRLHVCAYNYYRHRRELAESQYFRGLGRKPGPFQYNYFDTSSFTAWLYYTFTSQQVSTCTTSV